MKTFHELNEAFPSLFDDNGERKPFNQFLNDVQSIDKQYNSNYLRSEYNFANASASMAARWESFTDDDDYLLEYRTAGDDKVRPEHAEMNGIKLPMRDSFWYTYFPPNGWNCRCTVVEVLRATNEPTDRNEAFRRASEALKGDKKGMFNFNPGKEQKTFPDYNPYTISKCKDCNKRNLNLIRIPNNEICKACEHIYQCALDRSKKESEKVKFHYLNEMKRLYKVKVTKSIGNEERKIGFNEYGNDHLYGDTCWRSSILKKEDLATLDSLLRNSRFVKKAEKSKPRTDNIERFYYYETDLHGQKVYLNVAETEMENHKGKIIRERFLYSITDKIK